MGAMRRPECGINRSTDSHVFSFLLIAESWGSSIGIKYLCVMDKNKNEELQSRRDFFKKAAKTALPILGAIVLANTPAFVKAVDINPTSCVGGTCTGMCSGGCSGSCKYGCEGTCKNACKYSCSIRCADSCSSSCKGSCEFSSR